LTVRTLDRIDAAPFTTALVAVDDSEPADAALAVAATLARTAGTQIVACHAIDTARVHAKGAAIVQRALACAQLASDTPVAIVEGEPIIAITTTAADRHATVIVVGTHGRRGLQRFFLGSVAEGIVRTSDIPVLVVAGTTPVHQASLAR
jgi:nucleotide-binding universal stress UspA family protein